MAEAVSELRVGRVRIGLCPKTGAVASEDAAAVDAGRGLLAVADGASASPRAREWAEHLCDRWLAVPDDDLRRWLFGCIESFPDAGASDDDAWFVVEAAERPAFATLLVARLSGRGLRVVSVGDTCLFVVRNGALVVSHPLTDPADFGSTPALVEAAADTVDRTVASASTAEIEVVPGDVIVVATDASAAGLLESGAWATVVGSDDLSGLVRRWQEERVVEDDDLLVLVADVEGDP